jgi:hypothetical protein
MRPSLRRLWPKLVLAGALPVVGYILLRPHVGSDATALSAVMVFPLIDIAGERLRNGSFEPIGIIAVVGIAVGIAGALLFHGNTTLLKVRDSLLTGVFGIVCLLSLSRRRPAMFYLGRSFVSGGDAERAREFENLWDLPGVPLRFRVVTAVWGVGLVAESVLRTALALTLSTKTFLLVTPVINWSVLGLLIWFSVASRFSTLKIIDAPPAVG